MCKKKPIAIVYGAYINAEVNWKKFINRQLMDLKKTGVLEEAHLYIAVTNPKGVLGVSEFFTSLDVTISVITIQTENQYEYPAIRVVYDLAHSSDEYTAIAYLHTKGISYFKGGRRDKFEEALMETTFSQWRKVRGHFEGTDGVCKAGAVPSSEEGFIWFNFWWARPSYIRTLESPKISEDRYYYEFWLGGANDEISHKCKTLSIADWGESLYDQPNAVKMIRILRVRYQWKFRMRKILIGFS
jgi:hypothetical protein